ncbi:MAG: GNAT family N-acetyltransferase [Actinomycetota bacterium]
MLIRDVRESELDATSSIMVAAYQQYASGIPTENFQAYITEIADVRRRLPHSELIVAEHEDRIVGAVTLYKDATLSEHQGWPSGYAEIRLLAVAPQARGLGLGHKLTEECIRRAEQNANPFIALHTSNLMYIARDMYERMGFERVPEFDFHPTPKITAIAYRFKL